MKNLEFYNSLCCNVPVIREMQQHCDQCAIDIFYRCSACRQLCFPDEIEEQLQSNEGIITDQDWLDANVKIIVITETL